jgi:hypothetical protein
VESQSEKMARIGQAGTRSMLQGKVLPSFVFIGKLLRDL